MPERIGDRVHFYLGTHRPDWLGKLDVPLFVSRRTLAGRRRLPRARAAWALDSGGFSELHLHGGWTLSPRAYVDEVRRYADEIGYLAWASPMDWMCETEMLARTGLTVAEHQRRTIADALELRALAPDLPWIPVLQGWTLGHYLDCAEAYERAGIDLSRAPLVGVGTLCRRQRTMQVGFLLTHLASLGLRLHGFGLKVTGLQASAHSVVSADSLAWSMRGRYERLDGHEDHTSCANCLEFALQWRRDLLERPVATLAGI